MKKFLDFGTVSDYIDLNVVDIIKWFIVAILSASLTALYNFLTTWVVLWQEQWKFVLVTGVAAWIWYLIKNVFTNSESQLLTPEPPLTTDHLTPNQV
jgi:hypothetical protein